MILTISLLATVMPQSRARQLLIEAPWVQLPRHGDSIAGIASNCHATKSCTPAHLDYVVGILLDARNNLAEESIHQYLHTGTQIQHISAAVCLAISTQRGRRMARNELLTTIRVRESKPLKKPPPPPLSLWFVASSPAGKHD
jgi:hypothetical protein